MSDFSRPSTVHKTDLGDSEDRTSEASSDAALKEMGGVTFIAVFLAYVFFGGVLNVLVMGASGNYLSGVYISFLSLTTDIGSAVSEQKIYTVPVALTYVVIGVALCTIAVEIAAVHLRRLHWVEVRMLDEETPLQPGAFTHDAATRSIDDVDTEHELGEQDRNANKSDKLAHCQVADLRIRMAPPATLRTYSRQLDFHGPYGLEKKELMRVTKFPRAVVHKMSVMDTPVKGECVPMRHATPRRLMSSHIPPPKTKLYSMKIGSGTSTPLSGAASAQGSPAKSPVGQQIKTPGMSGIRPPATLRPKAELAPAASQPLPPAVAPMHAAPAQLSATQSPLLAASRRKNAGSKENLIGYSHNPPATGMRLPSARTPVKTPQHAQSGQHSAAGSESGSLAGSSVSMAAPSGMRMPTPVRRQH